MKPWLIRLILSPLALLTCPGWFIRGVWLRWKRYEGVPFTVDEDTVACDGGNKA